jgi:hypothetical protein
MAQYDVPVTITAKDEASDKIENIGKESKKTRKAIEDFADKAKKKFKQLAGSADQTQVSFVEFQSRVEAVKSVIDFITGSIAAFTEASREMRGENDQLVKSVDDVGMALKGAQGALGDIGLALVQVFEEDAKEASAEFQKTIRDNRETIVQFLVFFVQSGKRLFHLTKALIIGPFNLLVDGFRTSVQAIITATIKLIQKGLSAVGVEFETLDILAESTGDTLNHFLKEGDASIDMIGDGLVGVFDSITETGKVMDRVTANMQKDPFKPRLKTAEKLAEEAETEAEAKKETEKAERNLLGFLKDRQAMIDKQLSDQEKAARLLDELLTIQMEKEAEAHQQRVDNAQEQMDLIGGLGESFASAALESESFTQGLINGTRALVVETTKSIIESAKTTIMAKAVEAAASAASSAAAFGPIAMAGAGVAALALVQGLIDKLPKFAQGGMVRGGVQGQDSVPILAMPGEYVMNVNQVEAMRQMFSNMDGVNSSGRFANGGTVGPAPSLGGVNITIRSEALPNKTEVAKYVRSTIMPAMRDLQAQGAI